MKTARELAPAGRKGLAAMSARGVQDMPDRGQLDAMQRAFDETFRRICVSCSGFRASLPDDAWAATTKQVWLEVFLANGSRLTLDRINSGIRKLQANRQKYLPSPQEFVDLCVSGGGEEIPTMEEAKAEIMAGRKPWSCKFVEYLAVKTGSILHPSTNARARDAAFSVEYKRVKSLVAQGFFEQGDAPRLHVQQMDENLQHYFYLRRSFPEAGYAADFMADCKRRGIILHVDDPDNLHVTRSAVIVDQQVRVKRSESREVNLSASELQIAELILEDPLMLTDSYLDDAKELLEKISLAPEYAEWVTPLKCYIAVNSDPEGVFSCDK